jgi:DNA polymerase/3'-5' exonuclease PolX
MPIRKGFFSVSYSEGIHIYNIIKNKLPCKSYVVGSIRRNSEYINDIDILVVNNKNIDIIPYIPFTIIRKGSHIISGIYAYNGKKIIIDIFITSREELPFAMLQYTGPKSYNIRLRYYIKNTYGWLLNQHGLFYQNNPTKKVVGSNKIKTEKQLIAFIGTTYYAPELRE